MYLLKHIRDASNIRSFAIYILGREEKMHYTHDISLRYIWWYDALGILLFRCWLGTGVLHICLAIKCSWLGRSWRTNSCIYKSNTPSRTCTRESRVQYRRCCNSWNQSPNTTTCSRSHSCCRASVLPPDLAKKTGRAWCKCWRWLPPWEGRWHRRPCW
jgi:hypothetical protein